MSETNTVLAELLAELGWSPEGLAKRLNAMATAQARTEHLHPKSPYKWVRGHQPSSPWPALVAALLSQELHRPIHPGDLGWADNAVAVPADSGLALPWTAAGGLRALQTVTEGGAMDRRIFITLVGSAVTNPALEWLIAKPADDVATTAGRDLPVDVVDHLDTITAELRRMDDSLGGGRLLNLVDEHLRTVVTLLEHCRYTETTGRRLHHTAGELLRLAGWLSFDDNQHARAQRYWTAALHAAHAAGDRALGANILGFQSCQAKDLGQIREAVNLAESARRGYPGVAPTVRAILDLRAAEAYANERSYTDTRRAVDAAFDALGGPTPQHGEPDWCYWLTETHAHGQAGYCYIKLHDWERARLHLREAIRLQGPGRSREGALRQTLLATTYVRQKQPAIEPAIALGTEAVQTLRQQVSSARCIRHVAALVDHLAPYRRNPAVRGFIDLARELATTAGSRPTRSRR